MQVCLQHSFDFPQKYRIIIAEENANQVTAGFTGRFSTFSKPDIASTVYITTKQKFELLCFLVYHKMVKIGTANFSARVHLSLSAVGHDRRNSGVEQTFLHSRQKILLRDGLFENTK